MSTSIIQVEYDVLDEIAQRFQHQSEAQDRLNSLLKQRSGRLQQGGWIGRGAYSFFAEMEETVLPAAERLSQALAEASRVTLEISRILCEAEQEAAAPFKHGKRIIEGRLPEGVFDDSAVQPGIVPSPRVYIVNGINSAGDVPGEIGDDQTVALKQLMERWGYDDSEIVTTHAIFLSPHGNLSGTNLRGTDFGGWLSPIDWITGGAASAVNAASEWGSNLANHVVDSMPFGALYGSLQVLREYKMGAAGPYTTQVFSEIQNDIADHPLAPGQGIVLIGHSGGGAVVTNLAGKIEIELGKNVSGVITMGSPVANYDEAARYAETIVQVRHQNDMIGLPMIRSAESRKALPIGALSRNAWMAFELVARHTGDHPHINDITLQTPAGGPSILGPHGAYMDAKNPGASTEMMHKLQQIFPEMRLYAAPSSP